MSRIMNMNKGFTLVELLISLAIFAVMTALLVAKYGNFDSSVLLTDTAYDVALAVRTAQTYGVSVKNAGASAADFNKAYGVDFDESDFDASGNPTGGSPDRFTLFSADYDTSAKKLVTDSVADISTYFFKNGAKIQSVCVLYPSLNDCRSPIIGSYSATLTSGHIRIFFVRPDPDAHIVSSGYTCAVDAASGAVEACSIDDNLNAITAQINIQSTDGSTRTIIIQSNGQISVGS